MSFQTTALIVSYHTFVWSLIGTFGLSYGTLSDISCLKSIKESLEDPFGYLNSWNFNNATEGFICEFEGVECYTDENKICNIKLSNRELRGSFPQGIRNCTSLRGLDLSHNRLWGPIPPDIGERLRHLTRLDLSYNNFSGKIPPSFANCTYLKALDLESNQFTGQIPPELGQLKQICTFSVAENQLSGPVPDFNHVNFMEDSYENNGKLCGGPMGSCRKNVFTDSFKQGFLVGWVSFPVSFIAAFMFNCVPDLHEKLMKKKKKKKKRYRIRPIAFQQSNLPTVEGTEEDLNKEVSDLENFVTRICFSSVREVTNDFSEIIGLGKMGAVYKGTLSNGWSLAVMRLHNPQHFEETFTSELTILGRLRHKNLVPLLGFCIESRERILVYKYMPNGNLYSRLHPAEINANALEWPLRLKIAIGLARGLAWLHHSCNFRIIHLNISSKHILLDHNFEPKLINFGRAMLMKRNGSLNKIFSDWDFVQKDIFNFGVVLLELITGKEPNKLKDSSDSCDQTLHFWITRILKTSFGIDNTIDKSLLGQGFDGDIFHLLRVARNCVQPFLDRRPTMFNLYHTLNLIGKRYGLADDS